MVETHSQKMWIREFANVVSKTDLFKKDGSQSESAVLILRMCLIEDGFFLPVGNDSLQSRLDVAYQDFRAWCHANRINCSQPPFTVKLEPCWR